MSTQVDVKAAAAAAFNAARTLLGDDLDGLRLEEVEMPESTGQWIITLSYLVAEDVLEPAFFGLPARLRKHSRQYKQFFVDADSGQVTAMKIRIP